MITVAEQLRTTRGNASYTSPESQNEFIKATGSKIVAKIVADIKEAKFFSILVDDTADFSHTEQFSATFRFMSDTGVIREEFVGFQEAQGLTGVVLARQIIETVLGLGLDPQYWVGQGYDGASSMSYLSMMTTLVEDIERRFDRETHNAPFSILNITPNKIVDKEYADIEDAVAQFADFLDDPIVVKAEFCNWKRRCVRDVAKIEVKSAFQAFNICDAQFALNMKTLLKIFCTMPVTTAEAERSFSTMNRLKWYLRSTMGQDRLTNLALMNIHASMEIYTDEVIDEFVANGGARRLNFTLKE